MKQPLFGKNVPCSCAYCAHAINENGATRCGRGKEIKNGACRGFSYDPLMRQPRPEPKLPQYRPEDFSL